MATNHHEEWQGRPRTGTRALVAQIRQAASEGVEPLPAGPRLGSPAHRRAVGRARLRSDETWPRWLVLGVEIGAVLTILVAAVYGPPLYTCRQMRDQGLLYYGTSVDSCVRERVSARYEAAEDYVVRITRRL